MGAGRLELPSTYATRMPASSGSNVGVLPRVLAEPTGPLGYLMKRDVEYGRFETHLGSPERSDGKHRP